MKITSIANFATKIIAAFVFLLLVTVLSIKDYSVAGNQVKQDNAVTASTTQHPNGRAAHESHRL
jgi:hypothetical protein